MVVQSKERYAIFHEIKSDNNTHGCIQDQEGEDKEENGNCTVLYTFSFSSS